ncbi:hypothetical protein CVT24_008109 [Panaeolus cyanescens]|uniref:IRG-type G domain-containing protein n=1 Tax=Panaeolus cyanescens TaxID=181874 RepID=A0A409YLG4_9AGAR|nr:hypothetical protein CVT24_008109 [Panaeolus cyanescens]
MGNSNSRSEDEYQRERREAEARAAEARQREEEARRLRERIEEMERLAWEEEQRAEESRRREEEARRARERRWAAEEEERRRREEERRRRDEEEAERRRVMQETMERAEQERVRAEREKAESERQAAEARRQEEEAKEQAERMRRLAEEMRVQAEEAARKAEEAKREAEDRLMRGIPPDLHPNAEERMGFRERYGLQTNKINIAIVGESGTGKSTLLNSIRGLSAGDDGAAAAGFDETTEVVEGYLDPCKPFIMWYDVPGANTPNVKGWTYFIDQGLYVFDILVVVFSGRFTETAGTLLENANKCSIPTFLVRTKADSLMRCAKEDTYPHLSDGAAKELVAKNTRDMVAKNLKKMGLPEQRVYVVSRPAMKEWVVNGRQSFEMIHEVEFLDDVMKMLQSTVPGASASYLDAKLVSA